MPARTILHLALGAALVAPAATLLAQEFPSKPVRIILYVPPGGVPDGITRMLAPSMQASLGQPVVIDTKPGAGGINAVNEFLRAAPDGHTLICIDQGQWAILPALKPGGYGYDPVKDFAPVAAVVRSTIFVTVREDSGIRTIQELVALAKAKPGSLSYGTPGIGSIHQLFTETLNSHYGINLVHVPYKGGAAAMEAVLGGSIPITVTSAAISGPHVKAGKIRRLLAATPQRSRFAPETPALADVGIDNDFGGDVGYVARAGTPRPIIDKLAAAMSKAAEDPEYLKRVEGFLVEPLLRGPDRFAEQIRADVARYARAVKLSGATAD